MHSFLLIDIDKKTQEKKKEMLLEKYEVGIFDQLILETEKSIGIEDIRNLQKKLILSPFKSKIKAAIIYNADSMTPDGQNAFLKTLEEPPDNTIIVLLAQNKEKFLPTVLSRCTILQENTPIKITTYDQTNDITSFQTLSLGEKLKLAQERGKTKETALVWLEQEISVLRNHMIKESNLDHAITIRLLQKTHATLSQTNVNARLTLEHLLLSLQNDAVSPS